MRDVLEMTRCLYHTKQPQKAKEKASGGKTRDEENSKYRRPVVEPASVAGTQQSQGRQFEGRSVRR